MRHNALLNVNFQLFAKKSTFTVEGLLSSHKIKVNSKGRQTNPSLTSDVKSDWIADSVSLGIMSHTSVYSGLTLGHTLENQGHVADDDARRKIVRKRLLL